ncbi:DNA-directed RNA polymerase subunit E'' [Methanoculleus chikugoensis]|jgi:DNA-directed RNA polymerase subunit E"|uniref:Transcription elongation factor Spt4 n=1 Tax=Methanoculleus chikugoensis TaxID=118126 RepID=A0A1M4MM05_9EURY|nr:transcription elongation factor subunit Spt4 [Methanoculleus chikugoensis]MDD4567569.1 DNA-directed RNA polymerase, subunit E'' [Methanoculleus chikugoensis]NMA11351.1 DNA-directed RNA polymerase, subunit E'' [Methanomicrobiales archaeon]BBL69381.1 DNA-directed RNA polymerase subunit E'' [Methanoculleus chikugoensis]SCL75939.1 DNA-directed RNA polymerase subunit E'' [Methanoculleus chikugoensis]
MVVRKKVVKVCRECHRVVEGESCVICATSNLSEDWAGYVVIIDPERSEIAKKMNVTMAGRYALKVR